MNAARRTTSALHPYAGRYAVHDVMPDDGIGRAEILRELREMAAIEDRKGDSGRVSGSIYSGDHEHYAFQVEAFACFAHANVLQRDMYPSATKMEAEIIAMTADMLHGDNETGGLVTTGGTDSLVTAMLAYREWGRHSKGIDAPQVVVPVSAHPALDKAFHYFGIEAVKAPLTSDYTVDLEAVRQRIGPRTVALVGTAGTYPHGVVDPITELGQLALSHGVGLHVDGCLGGFILPWATELGYKIEPFDLAVPGVTSMSADTHKYGYALKGSSVLLFRPKSLRREQYLVIDGWPGGNYASPSMSGSRSGGLIAATWASLLSFGRQGYRRIAADIFSTASAIKTAVLSHDELALVGESLFNVAFRSDVVDIFHVNDSLTSSGWRMNGLQNPPALHFCVTRPNTAPGIAEEFAGDLARAIEYARRPPDAVPRSGAMYGAGGITPDRDEMIADILDRLDAIHEVGPTG